MRLFARAYVSPFGFEEDEAADRNVFSVFGDDSVGSSAFASLSGELRAASTAVNSLSSTGATAIFSSNFSISGNPESVTIPLNWNFQFNGELKTTGVGLGFATARVSFNGSFSDFPDTDTLVAGSATLRNLSGAVSLRATGIFEDFDPSENQDVLKVRIVPTVTLEIGTTLELTEDDLLGLAPELGFDFSFEGPASDYNFPELAVAIANAINLLGIPRLEILPGVELGVNFEITYLFDAPIRIETTSPNDGEVFLGLTTGASALGTEYLAIADYSNSVTLKAVTVPEDFNELDLGMLRVALGTGTEVRVFQEVDGTIINGTDEDDLLTGTALADIVDGRAGNDTLVGADGADTLVGGIGQDELIGNEGNDTLEGDLGDDLYRFNIGDGQDTLREHGGLDTIQLGLGITPSEVQLERVSSEFDGQSDSLLIRIGSNSDQVLIREHFSSESIHQVEVLQFDDGTSWDLLGVT